MIVRKLLKRIKFLLLQLIIKYNSMPCWELGYNKITKWNRNICLLLLTRP